MFGTAVGLIAGPAFAQTVASPPAPPTAERRVDITEYDISGNSLLPAIEVQKAVYPFEGPGRTMADPEKARAALQKVYEARGYQAVSVVLPPQSVQGGVVRLEVVEAKTAQVTVLGARHVSQHEVLGGLTALKPGQSPNFKDLNTQLIALNTRSADLQVTPQLKPGSAADTLDVDLTVEDKSPLHGGLELNNAYSRDTHQMRAQANLSYDDLWHLGHSISAMYDVAPQDRDDAEVYALTYSAPLPGTDIRLAVTGLVSNSDVTTLGSTGVLGKGHSVTLAGTLPLPGAGGFSQSVQATVAYKDFTDAITVGEQSNTAPVTYFPVAATYNAGWRGDKDLVALSGAVNFAFRGLGSSTEAFDNKRFRAQGNFLYFRGSASWQHDLPFAAQVYGEADGQVSNEPLISNEQFSAGGSGSVRGYLQSDALGDEGVHATIELRTPPLEHFIDPTGSFISGLRVLAFADYAHASLLSPLPEQGADFEMTSVGIGLRSTLLKTLHLDMDYGDPLRTVGATSAYRSRVHFRLYANF
jgi:hemolysin activation/secretion protein